VEQRLLQVQYQMLALLFGKQLWFKARPTTQFSAILQAQFQAASLQLMK